MPHAISILPDEQAKPLLAAYRAAGAARRATVLLGVGVALVLVLLSGWMAEVRPGTLFAKIGNFGSYLQQTLPVLTLDNLGGDLASWYWGLGKWLRLLGETILIAYLGTVAGAIGAFLLCFAASANMARAPLLRWTARRFLEFCRTVPEIVFALIFVIAFGLGPVVGVFALAIHTIGALGKLFSEIVENIDMKPVEGIEATGASWPQVIRFAVVPQVLAGFASYTLLRFEINVRSAGVMGFVGAGGIGMEFLVAIRNFYYTDVSAILLLLIVTVTLIDLGTERLRRALMASEGRH